MELPSSSLLDYNPSRKSLIRNKWISTTASIWIQCTSGSLYTFPIYSPLLKSTLNYSQSSLGTISVFKDIGANVGVLSGVLYSAAGPWAVLLAGAAQCFLGYFMIWLTVTGRFPKPELAVMCLYMFLAAHAMTFFNTANVVTGVCNFPNFSGTVVGIMKGFLGLSGAVLIQVYQTIFKNKATGPSSYLLMLAMLPSISSLLLMGFVRIYKTNEEDEKENLNGFSFLAVILAAYLMAIIIIQNFVTLKLSLRVLAFIVLIVLLLSPISVVLKAQRDKSYRLVKSLLEHNQVTYENDDTTQSLGEYHEISNGAEQVSETTGATEQWRGDKNLFQAMGTLSFWFLFFTTACALGSGLATVNNMSQIGESLGYTTLEINTLVSLWSIWNFLGRFGAGYISEYFLHVKGCPRPLFIVLTLLVMSVGHAMIAFAFPGALYVGSILVGVCYGSQWSLMPTITSDIFGKAHLGTIFNTITIAGPIGSYLLSVRVVGYIYDKEASGYGETCIGRRCFMLSFIIMAAVTFLGFLAALALVFRTRSFYKHVILPRLMHSLKQSRIITEDTE